MKKFVPAIVCFFLLTLAAAAQVNNYYVVPTGNDANDGSQAHPWATWAKADRSATLGAGGTVIHFADGTYVGPINTFCGPLGTASFCVSRGGTSTQRLTYRCDNGLNGNAGHPGSPGHCLLRASSDANNAQLVGTVSASFVTIQGFDIGGDSAHPASQAQAAVQINTKDGTGNQMELSYNYAHDVAYGAPSGNNPDGEGAGCPQQGVFMYNSGNPPAANRNPKGGRFIGNIINNGGNISNPACNQFHGMYIGGGPNIVVQNNIVSNTTGSGIKMYSSVCESVISNNLVFHTAWWGILVANTSNGDAACAALGSPVGHTTVNNNIVVNTGFNKNCGAIAEASGAGPNMFANNMFIGNPPSQNNPVVNCSTTPVSGSSTVTGTINTPNSGVSTANTFVNYRDDGTGDYHLRAGSLAISAGSTACVSGGMNPCVPAISLAGILRSLQPSIGFDEMGGTNASAPPDAPANLTATVQ